MFGPKRVIATGISLHSVAPMVRSLQLSLIAFFAFWPAACGESQRKDPVAGAGGSGAGSGGVEAAGKVAVAGRATENAGAGRGPGGSGGRGTSSGLGGDPGAGSVAGGGAASASGSTGLVGFGGVVSSAGTAGMAGATSAESGPCTLWPAPLASVPSQFTLGGTTVRDDEHDCSWALGTSQVLPTPVTDSRLLFHYDVNGDGIDDLFVAPPDISMTKHWQDLGPPGITLLVSKLAGGDLSFQPTGCKLDWPTDRVYLLRDLDADGVPDFVVSKGNGIQVLVNRPSGPEVTIDYDFPTPAVSQPSASLLGTVVGDFDGDGQPELAVGFSRNDDPQNAKQLGALLFKAPASTTAEHGPAVLIASHSTGSGSDATDEQLGYITAVRGGTSLFGLAAWSGWLYEQGKLTTIHNPKYPYGSIFDLSYPDPFFIASVSLGERELVLVGLYDTVELYDPWKNEHVIDFSSSCKHYDEQSYAFIDLDGDGDNDLVEFDATNPASPDIIIHDGSLEAGPASDSHDLVPRNYRSTNAETPFLKTGRAAGRLLVTGADWQSPADFPIRVTALGCGQTAARTF